MKSPHTIDAQLACVQREIRMRERKYPEWVEAGRMNKFQADHELACMKAVLATLMQVAQGSPPKLHRS
jgi:hypothetical protein